SRGSAARRCARIARAASAFNSAWRTQRWWASSWREAALSPRPNNQRRHGDVTRAHSCHPPCHFPGRRLQRPLRRLRIRLRSSWHGCPRRDLDRLGSSLAPWADLICVSANVLLAHRNLDETGSMNETPLYPLRFEPIYQYRPWGGRRLANLLSAPLPGEDLVGEAWLLSDRDDHASLVADGPLKGKTIRQLLLESPGPLLGKLSGFSRFPLLLKFLDV